MEQEEIKPEPEKTDDPIIEPVEDEE